MTEQQYPTYQIDSLESALSRLERQLPEADFRIEWGGETAYIRVDPCPVVRIVAIYKSREIEEMVPIVAVRERYAEIIRELVGLESAGGRGLDLGSGLGSSVGKGLAGVLARGIQEVRESEIEEWR